MTPKLNTRQLLKILQEAEKRKTDYSDIFEDTFDEQKTFINDPSKLVAALCTRRAGKSYGGAGLKMVKTALENPGCSVLYVALTRQSAKSILCKDILNVLDKKYRLNTTFNAVELTYTFPNKSVIRLMGMNASPQEAEKALGQKYKLVVIDEAGSFTQDLYEIVYNVLKPAVADESGQIVLIGTPRNITRGLYYDVTTGKELGWSVHKWTWRNNTFKLKQLLEEHDELVLRNPRIVETPGYKQNWCGEWIVDLDALVYKFNSALLIPSLPEGNYTFVLGVDLGYEDDSAFTVVAYNNVEPILYVVYTYKKSKMDITEVANTIKSIAKRFDISKYIVDGAAKQAVEEIKRRHGIPLVAAEKQGKADFIEIVNAELIQERVLFVQKTTQDLVEELQNLIWDDRSKKKQEHPSCPNHLCDSFLYAFRESYHYLGKPPENKIHKYSEEAIDVYWEQQGEMLQLKAASDWWER